MFRRLLLTPGTKGCFLVIVAAILYAIVHIIAKPVVDVNDEGFEISPVVLALLIYAIVGLFFTPIARKTDPITRINKKDIFFMMLIGLAEGSALITYFFGLKEANAVNASIFSNGEIVFSLVIAMMVFRERLRGKEIIPFSMIMIGMIVIPIGSDLSHSQLNLEGLVRGDALILLSGFLYAVDVTICKYVGDKYDPKRVTQVVSLFCAGFAFLILVAMNIPFEVNMEQVPSIIIIAIAGTGISNLLFLIGLKLVGAVRTVLLYSTTSVFGIIFSITLLAESASVTDYLSITFVMAGIFLLRNKLAEAEADDSDKELKKTKSQSQVEPPNFPSTLLKKIKTELGRMQDADKRELKARILGYSTRYS